MKYDVIDFIKWGLRHTIRYAAPADADMPLTPDECGIYPTRYLFGTVWKPCTKATLNERFVNHYAKQGYTEEDFDRITSEWSERDYATDCQGLLDAWLTTECNEKTDINAHMNYTDWCTDKGAITDIDRPYVIGEALFVQSKSKGRMTHVGWICGYDSDGTPLVVEARGLRYGVVVTRLDTRPWTHRGIMDKKFKYAEEIEMEKIKFEVTSPMLTGDAVQAMQTALSAAGYTDADGKAIAADGMWGKKSQAAFDAMIADYAAPAMDGPAPIEAADAATVLMHGVRITISRDGDGGDA